MADPTMGDQPEVPSVAEPVTEFDETIPHPEAVAFADMIAALDRSTEESRHLRKELGLNREEFASRNRRYGWFLVSLSMAVAILLVLISLVWKGRSDDNDRAEKERAAEVLRAKAACEQTNDARLGIRKAVARQGNAILLAVQPFAGDEAADRLIDRIRVENQRANEDLADVLPTRTC